MKKVETKIETKEVTTKTERIFCDLCDKEAKFGEWNTGCYKINDTDVSVSVKHRKGTQYPENSWGIYVDIDLCPECFRDKLIPWLESQGATVEVKKFDF